MWAMWLVFLPANSMHAGSNPGQDEFEILSQSESTSHKQYFLCGSVTNAEDMILIMFADDSIKGYGSVEYFQNPSTLETSFAISKSRVAPLKKLALSRLELMADTIAEE
ncbi:hypothetical protein AVEN_210766-1 [Araneus ventricosus]|uniref:Uncharacterized protein n=1 Tax=Araneus ventricosus TaxID=182803 RepID=A0A4Y2W2P2_ARAVE|nr:hypothetical protein AVEN_210766-1 [Araneus ventricosus]